MRNFIAFSLAALLLAACGGHTITYSGHEESTEGVPGFVNGKKVSPNVKLGQSYTVDGDTYVPHFQPDYVEEGMASWYGPGFHGGATANGESFDKHSMTAAHRTLPLPSIVKVTLLSTGKSVYVRINDRGPYARGRIIDLSYAAAEEVGLIGKGVGKVRVEYKLAESQRFADLLAQGRSPESIDIATEVLPYASSHQYAAATPIAKQPVPPHPDSNHNVLDHLNPVANANANELPNVDDNASAVESHDLPVAAVPATSATVAAAASPPITIQPRGDPPATAPPATAQAPPAAPMVVANAPANDIPMVSEYATSSPPATVAPIHSAAPTGSLYVQLGSFAQHDNAVHMQQKVANIGVAMIAALPSGNRLLYRVRMGPYNAQQANEMLAQLRGIGITGTPLVHQ